MQTVDVIMPVYNGLEHLRVCAESVRKQSSHPYRLIVVDDASTDEKLLKYLEELGRKPGHVVVRLPENRGFVAAVNRGFRESRSNDVIVLNSDTVVTKNWIAKLRQCAYSFAHVATVSPLTSYGSIFAVPCANEDNPLPAGMSVDKMGKLVESLSERLYPEVPTTNGFCMYIKRAVIDEIGGFDEETFGRGYGEENDFCMRAKESGWIHLADDATYVYHRGQSSYREERTELVRRNRAKIDQRYPYYTGLVREFIVRDPLAGMRARLARALESRDARPPGRKKRPRILFVLHDGAGGTFHTSRDLIRGLVHRYDCYELKSDRQNLHLYRHFPDGAVEDRHFRLARPVEVFDFWDQEYREIVYWLLRDLGIELIHIRHLLAHPFDVVELADELGIPTLLSFHDFYFVCPSFQLLDARLKYCAGRCNHDAADCELHHRWFPAKPRLKDHFLPRWRKQVAGLLKKVDGFVTTTGYAKDLHVEHYPFLGKKAFHTIPHGRDFPGGWNVRPALTRPARVVLFGALNRQKGLELVNRAAALADPRVLEFHLFGSVSQPPAKSVHYHGPYQRDELPRLVAGIGPSFALIPSLWAETFCHTLTEAWAMGLPAAVSDMGALRERMGETGAGWLVDVSSGEKLCEQLMAIAEDSQGYQKALDNLNGVQLKSNEQMAADYTKVYEDLLGGARR